MSIGNLKTDGGKGTNWPWQYKMLLGLNKIVETNPFFISTCLAKI